MPLNRNQDFMFEDTTTLTTNAKSLKGALNEVNASLADNTKQITDRIISAKDKQFGAVGDGVTDDTTALQSFFNYVANNKLEGKIPAGTYMISSEITIPSTYSWKVTGANGNSTTIKQKTNNTPILHFLSTPSLAHSIQIRGITFDYTSSQPSTNTNSYPIKIETMIYESIFDDLVFNNGTYAIYVPDGIQNFWGCTFDNIRFSNGLTVGAMRMSNLNAVPNNKFGRIYCHCGTMTGPAFSLKGYNFVIDNIEFLAANLGAQLMFFQAGTIVEIGAIKLEGGTYTAAQNLFEFSTSCKAHIGSINVGGTNITINPTSGNVYVVHSTGSAPSVDLTIAHVAVGGNGPFTNAYVFGSIGKTVLHTVDLQVAGWALCAISSTTGSETLIVNSFQNNHLSLDKGDANYTIAMGDPNTFTFDTVLTAPRTVNLPFDATKLFNGLKYRCIISANVATATNTITFLSSGQTYFTATTGKIIVEFTWRRKDPAHAYANWVMTDYVTLP